jgi:hypothetical protein
MMSRAVLASFLLLAARVAGAQDCVVPDGMKKAQKLPCVRAATALLEQPTLTLEQLVNGPGFNPQDPASSRFAWFSAEDTATCYFRPHYAFKGVKGQSLKFQCWQLTPTRAFYGRKGDSLEVGEVRIVLRKNSGGENRASIFPRADAGNEKEVRADRIKVKYLKPPHPGHNTRYNEVFTETAATRLLWALGFPADHSYTAGAAACVGCTADPFGDNLKDNTASVKGSPVTFRIVAVQRDAPFDEIDPEGDETWSWRDANGFHRTGQWTRQQKVAFDAYRLALALLTYHNANDVQNRLVCAEWKAGATDPEICARPMIMVQDLGSTFGKPRSFIFGAHSRGNFKNWQTQSVFAKPDRCELRHALDGEKQVLQEAQALMVARLQRLDRDRVKAVFRAAGFHLMDQEQLSRLRGAGAADVAEAALDEWTDVFMRRVAEIGSARNCRP